jgi:hypothetical protein
MEFLAHNWYDLHSQSAIDMVTDSCFSCTVPNWNSSLIDQQEKSTHVWSWHFLDSLLRPEKVTNQKNDIYFHTSLLFYSVYFSQ